MSFHIFSGVEDSSEILDMLKQLQTEPGTYAISDMPKETIKAQARKHGFRVSIKTVGYREIKVRLVDTSGI